MRVLTADDHPVVRKGVCRIIGVSQRFGGLRGSDQWRRGRSEIATTEPRSDHPRWDDARARRFQCCQENQRAATKNSEATDNQENLNQPGEGR